MIKKTDQLLMRMKFLTFIIIWYLFGCSLAWLFNRLQLFTQIPQLHDPVSMGSLLALTMGLIWGIRWAMK